jgi:DNA-binding beta-propeller fold protein YncE
MVPGFAQYSGPESVEYDPIHDRYLVSNTGSSSIVQRDLQGVVTPFITGLSSAPYGLEVQGDTLFACMGGGVRGFLLSNGQQVFNLSLGASFANGITSDGTYLYVTDFSAGVVFRVDVNAGTSSTWLTTGGQPNGIVYDQLEDRLLVVFWGGNAAIKAYDRATAQLEASLNTGLTNIDGVAVDCLGLVYVASWSPDQVTLIDQFLASVTGPWITGLNNPADIDFDAVHGRLCIPNSGNNTVTISALQECSVGIPADQEFKTLTAVPNPTNGHVRLELDLRASEPFLVYDSRMAMIASGTLTPNGVIDLSALPSGAYIIELVQLRKKVRVVKL